MIKAIDLQQKRILNPVVSRDSIAVAKLPNKTGTAIVSIPDSEQGVSGVRDVDLHIFDLSTEVDCRKHPIEFILEANGII